MPPRPTSENSRSKERELLKTTVLDAAQHLFGRRGYQQTTMEEVAKEAGVSVGTLYNMFEDKERLYAQVALRIGQATLQRLKPLAACKDSEQAVQDLIRRLLYNYVNDRLFFQPFCFPRVIYNAYGRHPHLKGPAVVWAANGNRAPPSHGATLFFDQYSIEGECR